MGGFLDWLGSKASDAEDWLGNAWDNETSQFTPGIEAIKSAADYGMEKSGQGLDFLTSMLGSTFDPTKPGMMDYTRDPFSQIRLDERGNASAPTIGEQATQTIDQPFIKHLLKSSIDIARNPASALVTNPVVGAAMAPGMIEDTSKRLGTLWSDLGDQGKSLSDPSVQEHLGELLPSLAMTGAGIHSGFHEVGPLSEALPEIKLGDYSSRSPIELKPTGWDERTKGSPSPVLGTAISEGGMKQIQPPDEAVTSVTDIKPASSYESPYLSALADAGEFLPSESSPRDFGSPNRTPKPVQYDPITRYSDLLRQEETGPKPLYWPLEGEIGSQTTKTPSDISGDRIPLSEHLASSNRVVHSTDTIEKLDSILSTGLNEGHISDSRGQGTSGPIALVYDNPGGMKEVPYREGDYLSKGISNKPKMIVVDKSEFGENGPALLDQAQALGKKYGVPVIEGKPSANLGELAIPKQLGPKPIELGTAIDSLARSLGWKPLGPDSRMVPPDSSKLPPPEEILKNIFTVQNPDWEKNPNELHQALLSEAERGDPAGQVKAYIDLISRKQPHRTGVSETYTPPVKTEIPTRITQTDLATKQQALLDQLAEKDPEIRKIQESIISKPVSRTEESQPVESTGSVVSEDNESIVPGGRDTVKLIDQISNAQNKEEINKESAPGGLKEQTKLIDQITKAQDAERIKNARGIDTSEEKAHIADLKSQLKAEGQYSKAQNKEEVGKSNQEVRLQNQIEKAQNKEELAQKSFKVTLDNGFVSNVRARDANTAKEFVQGYLDRGGNKRTIAKVEPKLSPLEMEAQGLNTPKEVTSNKPNPLIDKTAQVLDKLSGGLKSSVMSTGVPGTGFSPHGFSTLGRSFGTASYTTPMDNPVVASLKTMKYMAVPSKAVKYLKANEGYAKELEKQSPGFASPTEYSTPQNLLSKAHFKLFAKPLFQKIIPALKIEKAQTMENFYLKKGMNPEAARTKAIDDANVAFGGLKNWSQSRFNRIALFAPDWLETNARLATGTVKALANPNDPAGRMYRSYLANGLVLYALKGAIQYGLTGTSPTSNTLGHKEDINVGKEGAKDLFLRPEGTAYDSYRIPLEIAESIGKAYETGDSKYLGEIARIGVNRLGPLKVFANILFNRDYKGTPLWGKDTYNRPIPLTGDTTTSTGRPFPSTVTRVTNELEGTLPQPITSAGKFIEGTAGPIEFMSKGLGLPLSATSYKIENDFSKKGSSKKKSGYQSRYAF